MVSHRSHTVKVLQVLLFCAPFYDFLDHVSKNAVHSFKSETPLLDAMIVFMREFRVIGSAGTVEQLQEVIRGKGKDKAYGDPLTPHFLYDEMKRSKWFATLEVRGSHCLSGRSAANNRTARSSAGCGRVPGVAPPGS